MSSLWENKFLWRMGIMEEIKTYDIEMVEIDKIKLDETNPNEVDEQKMEGLRLMMKKKGMLQPIIIDQNNLMCDGEHRFRVFKELQMKKIPCYRLTLTDSERRLLRQTMNKLRGAHNPREDAEDLIRLSKELGLQDLSKYLGQEEKQLADFMESVNQVPESYLAMILEEKQKTKRTKFVSFKLTDYQAKKILDEMGDETIKDIVLIPIHGMLVDNIGREEE